MDIGHLTYQKECDRLKVKARRHVTSQLWGEKLELRHCGLLTPEVKAIALALMVGGSLSICVVHRREERDIVCVCVCV